MKHYTVCVCDESSDENPQRLWHNKGSFKSYKVAMRKVKQLSTKHHEAEIRGFQDGDIVNHQYWRDGKLHIDMNPS